MTNRLALILGAIIVALIALDLFLTGGEGLVFLGKKIFEFVEYLAFWR